MSAPDDLDDLASRAVSFRHVLIGAGLAIPLVAGAAAIGFAFDASEKLFIGFVGIAGLIAFAITRRVRTPASAFPTIRALRDRPADVGHIVLIHRGKLLLALVSASGALLAKPLELKCTEMGAGNEDDPPDVQRVLAIVRARCPQADVARITDQLGLTSLAKLATKAIRPAALPAARLRQ